MGEIYDYDEQADSAVAYYVKAGNLEKDSVQHRAYTKKLADCTKSKRIILTRRYGWENITRGIPKPPTSIFSTGAWPITWQRNTRWLTVFSDCMKQNILIRISDITGAHAATWPSIPPCKRDGDPSLSKIDRHRRKKIPRTKRTASTSSSPMAILPRTRRTRKRIMQALSIISKNCWGWTRIILMRTGYIEILKKNQSKVEAKASAKEGSKSSGKAAELKTETSKTNS